MTVPLVNQGNKPIIILVARDYTFVQRVNGALPERRHFLIQFKSLLDLWNFASVYNKLSVEDDAPCGGGSSSSVNESYESYESIPNTQNQFENNRLQPFDKN